MKIKLLIAALGLMALSGCAAFKGTNPVTPAVESGRPEVVAYALEGSYTIVQSKAREAAQDPATSQKVREVMDCVQQKANPVLDETRPLAVEAENVRAQVQAGTSTQDKLAIILINLNENINKIAPLITDLLAAINGKAQGVCAL